MDPDLFDYFLDQVERQFGVEPTVITSSGRWRVDDGTQPLAVQVIKGGVVVESAVHPEADKEQIEATAQEMYHSWNQKL